MWHEEPGEGHLLRLVRRVPGVERRAGQARPPTRGAGGGDASATGRPRWASRARLGHDVPRGVGPVRCRPGRLRRGQERRGGAGRSGSATTESKSRPCTPTGRDGCAAPSVGWENCAASAAATPAESESCSASASASATTPAEWETCPAPAAAPATTDWCVCCPSARVPSGATPDVIRTGHATDCREAGRAGREPRG